MRLPYFPLNVVLFPHLPLPLHIFEERYRSMARDLVADDSPYHGRFVVSMITSGRESGDPLAETHDVGTIAEVRSAQQLPDGRWVLLCAGVARGRITSTDRSGDYATAQVEPLPELAGVIEPQLLPSVQGALDDYLATVKRFVTTTASVGNDSHEITKVAASLDEVLKPIRLPDDPLAASYAVAGVLQIELTRKQQLLELPDAASRLRTELGLLRREASFLSDAAMPPVSSTSLDYNRN
jgi:Lon protease-like protein